MGRELLITVMTVLLAVQATAMAQEDVRKIQIPPPEITVIEEKCLVCHNRKLIEDAMAERRNMEEVLLHMEKRGVVLTEQERQVSGVFGTQKPFKAR